MKASLSVGGKLLVVDPLDVVCVGVGVALNESFPNFSVSSTRSISSALEIIRGRELPMGIIDLEFYDGDGIELLSRWLDWDPKARVLVYSERDEHRYAIRLMKAGAHGYVMKSHGLPTFGPRR